MKSNLFILIMHVNYILGFHKIFLPLHSPIQFPNLFLRLRFHAVEHDDILPRIYGGKYLTMFSSRLPTSSTTYNRESAESEDDMAFVVCNV